MIARMVKLASGTAHWNLVAKTTTSSWSAMCEGRPWSAELRKCVLASKTGAASDACFDDDYARSPLRNRCEQIAASITAHQLEPLEGVDTAALAERLRPRWARHCVEGAWTASDLACLERATNRDDDEACTAKHEESQPLVNRLGK